MTDEAFRSLRRSNARQTTLSLIEATSAERRIQYPFLVRVREDGTWWFNLGSVLDSVHERLWQPSRGAVQEDTFTAGGHVIEIWREQRFDGTMDDTVCLLVRTATPTELMTG